TAASQAALAAATCSGWVEETASAFGSAASTLASRPTITTTPRIGSGTAILSSSTKIPTTTAGIWPTTPGSAPTSTSNISARDNALGASLCGTAISACALTTQTHCAISLGDGRRLRPATKVI